MMHIRLACTGLLVVAAAFALRIPVAAAAPGTVAWIAAITGEAYANPTVSPDGTTIYIATHKNGGILYKIDGNSGAILRQTPLPGVVEHSPALGANGLLYLNTLTSPTSTGQRGEAVVAAYRADDLSLVWKQPLAGGADTSPVLGENNRVYLGLVVDPRNPSVVTSCSTRGVCGRYYSFDATTGEKKIDMPVEGWAATPGAIDEAGRVFFGVEDLTSGVQVRDGLWPGVFYAIGGSDPAPRSTTATLAWPRFKTNGDFGSPVSYWQGVVYATCRDGHLYGFRAATGEVVFNRDLGAPSWTGVTIGVNRDNDRYVLYTGTQNTANIGVGAGQIMAIELDGSAAGRLLWSHPVAGGMSFGNAALDDQGNVYYVTSSAWLQVRSASGQLLWEYQLPGSNLGGIGGPTILDNGYLVVASNDGKLFAFESSGLHLAHDVPWPKYKHDLRNTANILTPIRGR